jgi:DNA-binding beta-propeller fold protein YncE
MADMRRPDRGAGRERRRLLLATLASLTLAPAWVRAAEAGAPRLLVPWQTFLGARLAPRVDPTGQIRPGPMGGFQRFLHPTAVAARGPDLYVADSGAGTLYRVDTGLQAMTAVPGVNVLPGTRIAVGTDHSLYVLDPGAGRLRRFTRDGTPLQTFTDPVATARFGDFALDETGRRVFALDALSRRIVAFPPAGRAAEVFASTLEGGGELRAMGAIAADGAGLLVADLACRCLLRLAADGRVLVRLGEGELQQPTALVADRDGRVFVADAFDRSLKVFQGDELLATLPAAGLGANALTGLALDAGVLYIADGPGARVVALRVLPRRQP